MGRLPTRTRYTFEIRVVETTETGGGPYDEHRTKRVIGTLATHAQSCEQDAWKLDRRLIDGALLLAADEVALLLGVK